MSTAQDTALTTVDPESKEAMDSILAAYNDNVDQRAEVQIHRISILQPGSPEIAGGMNGYKPGHLVDNKTRELLTVEAKQPWLAAKGVPENELSAVPCVLIVVCMKLPTEFVKWTPQDERKEGDPKFEWKTTDGGDPRVRAGVWANRGGTFGRKEEERNKRPPVTDHINFLTVPVDHIKKEPKGNFIIGSFSRTSVEAGKMLTTYVQGHGMVALPPWGQTYWVYTEKQFNAEKNSYYYRMRVAPGPLLKDVCPQSEPMIRSMAIWLADKTFGRSRMETMLNIAEITDGDDAGHGDGTSTFDGTAAPSNPLGGAEDPFAGTAEPTKSEF